MSEVVHASAGMVAPTFVEVPAISKSIAVPKPPVTPSVNVRTLSLRDFNNLETRPQFLRDMRDSLMRIGTFYIKDHGISTEMTSDAMKTVREYFSLPVEEKKKMHIVHSRHFRGYKLMGEEFTNNQIDHREQLQFAPEQSPVESFRPSISPDYEGLQGPNQWPASTLKLLPHFKPCILEFMDQLEILSQTLMEAVALSLGLSGSYFHDLFGKSPYYRLKCAKYPSVNKASVGCGAHKDTGFLTVLLQDMVGGLQGQDPVTGQWMDTKPIPETFIVTMGEAVEKLTGGLYNATVHRVMNNTSGKDRYSIPFFYDPTLDARIPFKIENLATSASLDFEAMVTESSCTKADDKMEQLVHGLGITNLEPTRSSSQEGWSSGAHVFETVHRCHPEVYSRWYSRDY
ncbi:hypothetical protein BGZ65_010342 [Modicella reniformis]|uniref:Fe2OG dioxygenase domain-containing protein n=1 Tax=Modicella reniformis TaxID=1440133 RepID=A0A9P6J3Z9_9FUNG|nr:hypothetical protein BGZ65_010342 [Modicella reniformis]